MIWITTGISLRVSIYFSVKFVCPSMTSIDLCLRISRTSVDVLLNSFVVPKQFLN
jgi:hypothetical protein